MNILRLLFFLLTFAFVGCASVPYDQYGYLNSKQRDAIEAYSKSRRIDKDESFSAFISRMGITKYYIYSYDRMQHSIWGLLGDPTVANGYSVHDMMRHGNRIYAIPLKSYYEEVPPKNIDFWLVAERNRKMYAIGYTSWILADFKKEFSMVHTAP